MESGFSLIIKNIFTIHSQFIGIVYLEDRKRVEKKGVS